MNFYRWREQDFTVIPLTRVRVGDEMAWGAGSPDGSLYGVIRVDRIFVSSDYAFVVFCLPAGAEVHSSSSTYIMIDWDQGIPRIVVTQDFTGYGSVLVRR